MGVLDAIVRSKREEVATLKGKAKPAASPHAPLDVVAALSRNAGDALRLITEVKFKSPSAGPLSRVLSAAERAVVYAKGGAAMISVLCDGPFFDGSYAHLSEARAALDERRLAVPLLCKEFVLDEVQLDFARASGADAVLLIVRLLEEDELPALVDAALTRGLEPVVEIVCEAELERAAATRARIVGANARDLDTLRMDFGTAAKLVRKTAEAGKVALHFSGVRSADDVRSLGPGHASGALVGETLMRRDDPAPLLAELVAASISA